MALMKAHTTALLLVYIGLSQLQSSQLPDPFRLSSCIYCSMQKAQCGLPVISVYALSIPSVIIVHIAFIVIIILVLHMAADISVLGPYASEKEFQQHPESGACGEMQSYTPQCGDCIRSLIMIIAYGWQIVIRV